MQATRTGGCSSQRRRCPRDRGSPPGGIPGGEAVGEEELPLGSVLPLILIGNAVRWEGWHHHPLHRGTNRLREAQWPAPITQQWTQLASLWPSQATRCRVSEDGCDPPVQSPDGHPQAVGSAAGGSSFLTYGLSP